MRVEGASAKGWAAVRLDTLEEVNQGDLLLADSETGSVEWLDRTGSKCTSSLGPGAVRIVRRSTYGR